jgi:hypothetical protein
MVKTTKKHVKCHVIKPSSPKISAKNKMIHKKLLDCMNTKCTNFLEKDLKITEKCFDNTSHMKFFSKKKLNILNDCYKKNGFINNTFKKINCLKTKCAKESNKYNTLKSNQQIALETRDLSELSELSVFHKEVQRFKEKEKKIYPGSVKLEKIANKIDLIRNTIMKCKDESEKTKLRNKITKLNKSYETIKYAS